ncbi:MAG: hypothetical protein ACE366_26715 [Bradymonadia bacterium]
MSAHTARWIGGGFWDAFWVLNGVWLMLLAWPFIPEDGRGWGTLHLVYFVPTALLWLGHRFSSTWLAWFSAAYRPVRRRHPVRFFVVPFAVATLAFFWLLAPMSLVPIEPGVRLLWLGVIDFGLITWHFSAQHFGVLRLYRARAGDRGGRRLDRLVALGLGGAAIVVAELFVGTSLILDAWPQWQRPWHSFRAWAEGPVMVIIAASTIWALIRGPAHLGHRLYVVQLGALALGAMVLPPAAFVFAWTIQHWSVAMALAGRVVGPRPWRWMLMMMVVSVLALPWLEADVAQSADAYGPFLFPTLSAWIQASPLVPTLVAAGFATGFVHYTLDRAVFRLSDPEVRAAAAHLLEPPS